MLCMPLLLIIIALLRCNIEKTEERAITLQQLEATVWTQIERRCAAEEWEGSRPGPTGTDGKPTWTSVRLKPATVCLYDVDKYIIRPATVNRQCSFVELVALIAQPPIYFVSHWCATRHACTIVCRV